jgi:hypothetical protein
MTSRLDELLSRALELAHLGGDALHLLRLGLLLGLRDRAVPTSP